MTFSLVRATDTLTLVTVKKKKIFFLILSFYFHQNVVEKFRYLSISFRTLILIKLTGRKHHKISKLPDNMGYYHHYSHTDSIPSA